jgi:hypothetical protein
MVIKRRGLRAISSARIPLQGKLCHEPKLDPAHKTHDIRILRGSVRSYRYSGATREPGGRLSPVFGDEILDDKQFADLVKDLKVVRGEPFDLPHALLARVLKGNVRKAAATGDRRITGSYDRIVGRTSKEVKDAKRNY